MKKKLSSTQIHIIETLQAKEGRSIIPNKYYYGTQIVESDNKNVMYFRNPTLEVLKRYKIIIPNDNLTRYVLNPKIGII